MDLMRALKDELPMILNGIAESVIVLSPGADCIFSNNAAWQLLGPLCRSAGFMKLSPDNWLSRFEFESESGELISNPDRFFVQMALNGSVVPPTQYRMRDRETNRESWLIAQAQPLFTEENRVRCVVLIFRDVTAIKRRELQARFLARAGEILGEVIEKRSTLSSLAKLAVPELGDWCIVDVITEDKKLSRLSVVHADPDKVNRFNEIEDLHDLDPQYSYGPVRVACTGGSELIERVEPDRAELYSKSDIQLKFLLANGIRSYMSVPIKHGTRTFGVMTVAVSESMRRLDSESLEIAEELCRRASLAIENERLFKDAKESIRSRDEFISMASHELKTPVAALKLQIGLVEHLIERDYPPDTNRTRIEELLQDSERELDKLTRLVDQLFDVSGLIAGKFPLDLERIDLGQLVFSVVRRYYSEREAGGSQIRVHYPAPIYGTWDRIRLEQVLSNILSNAVRYGQGKPIDITLSREENDLVRISIRDQGIGIPPDYQRRIFERFSRAVSGHHSRGLGLGLFIAYQIVRSHGGKMLLWSEVGKGSEFVIELPLRSKQTLPAKAA